MAPGDTHGQAEEEVLPDARREVELHRFDAAGGTGRRRDCVATEEPLEIQLEGRPFAVVMRTPGHDEELVLGLLHGERVIRSRDDVAWLRHCSVAADPASADNHLRVRLTPGVDVDLEKLRRNLFASASCGVCGRATIENLLDADPPVDDASVFRAADVLGLPKRLRAAQAVFDRTGGLHGAGLFDPAGALLVAREDVGRHNAVDKVVGWALRSGRTPLGGHALAVSGRLSYEIVQKAVAARVPLVVAISAPSSLAVDLARAAGVTLAAFVREGGFNVHGPVSRLR